MYKYKAIIKRIIDGDTLVLDIDLGFNVWLKDQHLRLLGFDAPEIRTKNKEEKEHGQRAKAFVEKYLPPDSEVVLISQEYNGAKGKYGRVLGDIEFSLKGDNKTSLIKTLISYGFEKRSSY